jgi:hypothetical protein
MYLIKNSFNLISEPLTQLINLSLTTGVFPDKLKVAKVIPIYKAENPTSYPGSFHYAPRWRKDPGPGWSRVFQILGDNNWDLWGVGKANVAFEFKTIQGATSYPGYFLLYSVHGHLLRKDPGIVWSRVSQNLGGNNKFLIGWVTK